MIFSRDGQTIKDFRAVSARLLQYEFFYNYQRPHSALDYLTPS